jgi:hypothetical protein
MAENGLYYHLFLELERWSPLPPILGMGEALAASESSGAS